MFWHILFICKHLFYKYSVLRSVGQALKCRNVKKCQCFTTYGCCHPCFFFNYLFSIVAQFLCIISTWMNKLKFQWFISINGKWIKQSKDYGPIIIVQIDKIQNNNLWQPKTFFICQTYQQNLYVILHEHRTKSQASSQNIHQLFSIHWWILKKRRVLSRVLQTNTPPLWFFVFSSSNSSPCGRL